MLFVDDFSVVLVLQRVLSVLETDLFYDLLQEGVFYGFFAEYVVGSYAGLTAVEVFAEYDPLGGKGNIGTFVYDTGTLSPKL